MTEYQKASLFILVFSRVREILPDPDIYEDNGLRKPLIEIFTDCTYSIAGIVNAMTAAGWTFERVNPTLEYKKIKEE